MWNRPLWPANLLKQAGLPTGHARSERAWDQSLKAHAKTLWACDFLTLRALTVTGLKFAFALVFVQSITTGRPRYSADC